IKAPEDPEKAATAQYTYEFSGWTPEFAPVTGNATYTAEYVETIRKYTVTWKVGEVAIETDTDVEYGTVPEYNGMEIVYVGGDYYLITDWEEEIAAIEGNTAYTATATILDSYDKTSKTLYVDGYDATEWTTQVINAAITEGFFGSLDGAKFAELDGTAFTAIANTFKADHNVGNNAAARTATLAIYNDSELYKVNVIVATKVIKTATELASLQSYTTVETGTNAKNNTYYSYGGYFVLGNNITATGNEAPFSAPSIGSIGSGGDMVETYGFHGTFDGRGYTVDGFDFYIGGIFGDIGDNAVIKNVAFTGAKATKEAYNTGSTRQDGIGVLSANAKGSYTVENVYVEFESLSPNSGALLGRSLNGGTIKNTVIVYKQLPGTWNTGAIAGWGVYTQSVLLNNVYMILQGNATRVFGNTDDVNIKASSTYTVVAANEDPTAITYSGLDESIWKVEEDAIPTFITYGNSVFYMSAKDSNGDYQGASVLTGYLREAAGFAADDSTAVVTDIADASGMTVDDNWFSAHDASNDATGRTAILAYNVNGEPFVTKVFIATKVITTYSELASLQTYVDVETGTNAAGNTYYSYGGYFVLGNNITATGSEAPFSAPGVGSISSNSHMNSSYGFHGTFDGRGYTVSGFDYEVGGIFGDIGDNAVIKNVAFTGAKATKRDYYKVDRMDGIGVLAANAAGTFTIENVYVQFTDTAVNSGALIGRSISGGTISNTVIDYTHNTTTYRNGAVSSWDRSNSTVYTNVYMIVRGRTVPIYGQPTPAVVKSGSTYTLIDVAAGEDPTAITYSGFDKKIWKVSAGQIPTFKTAE
ncbi:MAG: hypothetical protein J6N93_05560, partial [Clostridia bacterium]|nr:hypothetical protein [Clostridia bacterium]